MEVSVWQGGTPLTSGYGAVLRPSRLEGVKGLWAPHAKADVDLGVEGQQAPAGQLPPLYRRQDACFVAEGGIQSRS